jgi:hypothetical protein
VQAAIDAAGDGTLIRIAAGTYEGPFIINNTSLVISGDDSFDAIKGGVKTVLTGNGKNQILRSTGSRLELRSLTFKNGFASAGIAVDYSVNGGAVVVDNCLFDGNKTSPGGNGGAIRAERVDVQIRNSRFSNNSGAVGDFQWCPNIYVAESVFFDNINGTASVFIINGKIRAKKKPLVSYEGF